ncbi:MAG: preprotein translocase subunit SecA, partial [Deltaproteobacteria bacterium]|nr:preprotein translocase subunit SecA [Deltaproteobacteria bacterium]
PGASRFYLSLEDDLMRIFGGERIANLMTRLKVEEDEAITHVLISRAIENAQKRVEGHNFEIRKHVLEYDDVMNKQREVVYGTRRELLGGDVENVLLDMADEVLEDIVSVHTDSRHVEEWDTDGLQTQYLTTFGIPAETDWAQVHEPDEIRKSLMEGVERAYQAKRDELRQVVQDAHDGQASDEGVTKVFHDFQRHILLSILDNLWKDHLLSMDHLREGIGLVGYAQKKPIDEYKREGFALFEDLMFRISKEGVSTFFRAHFSTEAPRPEQRKVQEDLAYTHGDADDAGKPSKAQKLANWGRKKKKKRAG